MNKIEEMQDEFITIKIKLISRYHLKMLAKRKKQKMYETFGDLIEQEFLKEFYKKAKNESTEKEICEEKESESCHFEKKVTETMVNNSSCKI